MEIEVTLKRIKVKPPRLMLYMDGPFPEDITEEEKAKDEAIKQAADEFNAKLVEIFGPGEPVDYGTVGRWHFPDWMPDNYRLLFASNWYSFKIHMRQLAAEARAMYLDSQKNLPEAETETPSEG